MKGRKYTASSGWVFDPALIKYNVLQLSLGQRITHSVLKKSCGEFYSLISNSERKYSWLKDLIIYNPFFRKEISRMYSL